MKKLEKEMQETEAVESQQKRAKLVSVKFAKKMSSLTQQSWWTYHEVGYPCEV